jgi:lipopolysaccharide biosynthesis protein
MLSKLIRPVDKLTTPWNFVPSAPPMKLHWNRARARWFRRKPPPPYQMIKPLSQRDLWSIYFVYSPDGSLSPAHRYTLSRLRDMKMKVFIIIASDSPQQISDEVKSVADALYWKGLGGYDFSAYGIALRAVAEHSPDATVYMQNDSVFGPFYDVRPFIQHSPWDLLGFTASSLLENHIQSYAFVMRELSPGRVAALGDVLPTEFAYSISFDVIECQEVRLAHVASKTMSVGACWYSVHEQVADPVLCRPAELVEAGLPYLKKSVLGGKHHEIFQPHAQEQLREILVRAHHPV